MAKEIVSAYTYSKSAKTITLTDFTTIRLDRILLIVDTTINTIVYNFADNTVTATVATNVLTLSAVPASSADADKMMIFYDGLAADPIYGPQPISAADASLVTLGAKADAKSTATDSTAVTAMQVLKQISASVQIAGYANMQKHVCDGGTLTANTKASPSLTVSGFTATEVEISNVDGASSIYYTLDGTTPATVAVSVTDMVTNSSTTITSATANFTTGRDTGRKVTAAGDIPAGTTIASVTNSTTVVLSQAATGSHSGQTLTLPINFLGVLPATPSNMVLPVNATPTLYLMSAGTPKWAAAVRGA